MKPHVLVFFLIIAVFLSVTGFQCGSAGMESAKLYIKQKQYDKAQASLQKELQKDPKNDEAWYDLGTVQFTLNNYAAMNESFTQALALSETHKADIALYRYQSWAALYNDGVKAYNKGKDSASYYDKAIEDFRTALAMEPDSVSTYYVTALASFAKKDFTTAVSMLSTAVQRKPAYSDAARLLGEAHYAIADQKSEAKDSAAVHAEYLKAAEAFELAYKYDPDKPDNIVNLVDAYEKTKQDVKALALTAEAVARDPNNKTLHYAEGVFQMKQQKYQDAIDQFKKAIDIDPEYSDAIYNCGVAYLNWGVALREAAVKAAEQQTKKGAKPKEDLTFKDKLKESLPFLEKAAQLRPDDLLLWQQLGKLYANLNMKEKSQAAFDMADKIAKVK